MDIVFEGISKVFPDGTAALHGLDLAFETGEFIVLLGPSGSGKTTACRVLAGLETPTGGRILVGTPKDIVTKLNSATVSAMADPAVRKRIADQGMEIPPREQQTPEALGAFHKAEIEKWWPIIKAAGIKSQ